METTHTAKSTEKVHVAGSPEGAIQRCTRCHTLLTDGRRYTGFWRTGGLVLSRRGGQSLITEARATEFRACGRAK